MPFGDSRIEEGYRKSITSDNGSNFVAGEKEIKDLILMINTNLVQEKTTSLSIEWNFNPPYSPHHGGVF